jgi:hypothetical protein
MQDSNSRLRPCPHLPPRRGSLDWRHLHRFRETDRGADFYLACLEYSQALWQRGLAARALLCLDRAFGADLRGDESVLQKYPLPYAAVAWLIRETPANVFIGNPRVHFQHYADRMNKPRRELRRWRAWGCWAITRAVRPELPPDSSHVVVEPVPDQIHAGLHACGFPGEADLWRGTLQVSTQAAVEG